MEGETGTVLALEMREITKQYPAVLANDHVSIQAEKGSIVCIIGENGAGKSTLMSILSGMEQPDSGEILLNGERVSFASGREAMKHKIGMVFQQFMLVNELSVLENIILGAEPTKGVRIDLDKARREIEEVMESYDMKLPLDQPAGSLWIGLQQKLEILKVLYRGAEIIILDEPTAVLTPQETKELFVNMRALAQKGKTLLFITHKLNEVMEVADDIYVMRSGKLITRVSPKDTSVEDLSLKMVGHELPPIMARAEVKGEKLLTLERVGVRRGREGYALQGIDMTISRGEILGVAGISGNGQNELAHVVAGLLKPSEGRILFQGKDITAHDRRLRIKDGISYIPEDRNRMGACLSWSVEDNSIGGYQDMSRFSGSLGILRRKAIEKQAQEMVEKFMIKTPGTKVKIASLSGGNCQKVIVARETAFDASLIIASEPSRGIDIHAINSIYSHIMELRNQGCGILLISSSLDEVLTLSDRVMILYEGKIAGVVDPKTTPREEIGLYMSGAKGGGQE